MIAIYVRVSTESQEDNNSFKDQRDWGIDFAKKLNEEYKVYEDVFSGATLQRPALQLLIKDIEAGYINKIWLKDLDRFSRDTMGALILKDLLEKYNVELYENGNLLKLDTPSDILNFTVKMGVATFEKQKIRERMHDGKLRVRRDGYLNTAIPPYGYHAFYTEDSTRIVEINQKEEENIIYIFNEVIEKNRSFKELADEFNNRLIPLRKGKKWWKTNIANIINQTLYAGFYIFEGLEVKSNKYPIIIKREKWNEAQRIINNRKINHNIHHNHHKSSALLSCWHCGSNVTYHYRKQPVKDNGKVIEYIYKPSYKINHSPDCNRIYRSQSFYPDIKLDIFIDHIVHDFFYDQEAIETYYLMEKEKNKDYEEQQLSDIKRLETEKKKINKQKLKYIESFADTDDEDITNKIQELSSNEKDIDNKIIEIKQRINLSRQELDDVLFAMSQDLEAEYASLEDEPFKQRQFIERFKQEAYIKDDKIYWKWVTGKEVYVNLDIVDRIYNDVISIEEPEEPSRVEIKSPPRKREKLISS